MREGGIDGGRDKGLILKRSKPVLTEQVYSLFLLWKLLGATLKTIG